MLWSSTNKPVPQLLSNFPSRLYMRTGGSDRLKTRTFPFPSAATDAVSLGFPVAFGRFTINFVISYLYFGPCAWTTVTARPQIMTTTATCLLMEVLLFSGSAVEIVPGAYYAVKLRLGK